MIITKKRGVKTPEMIKNDIVYGFNKLIDKRAPIYHITLTNLNITNPAELRFQLTNKLFNRISKFYKKSIFSLNYLFVIEYPEKVSRGNMMVDNCEVHTHIVLETDLPIENIRFFIEMAFSSTNKNWVQIERIDKRNDKFNFSNYLTKQIKLFTDDNYNFKIND